MANEIILTALSDCNNLTAICKWFYDTRINRYSETFIKITHTTKESRASIHCGNANHNTVIVSFSTSKPGYSESKTVSYGYGKHHHDFIRFCNGLTRKNKITKLLE